MTPKRSAPVVLRLLRATLIVLVAVFLFEGNLCECDRTDSQEYEKKDKINNIADNELVLGRESFRLRTSILNAQDSRILHLTESYSSRQRRAKLQFERGASNSRLINPEEADRRREFFHFHFESSHQTALVVNEALDRCSISSLDQLNRHLFPVGDDHISWANLVGILSENRADGNQHVVGLGSLLLIIWQRRQQMLPTKRVVTELISGQMAVYELKIQLTDSRTIRMDIYYPIARSNYKSRSTWIPARVNLSLSEDSNSRYHIRFGSIELIAESDGSKYNDDDDSSISKTRLSPDVLLDPFVWPIGAGCSRALEPKRLSDPFSAQNKHSVRLSFRTKRFEPTLGIGGQQFQDFVAFDGVIRSLRVENRLAPVALGSPTIRLTDFRLNRRYTIVEGGLAGPGRKCAITHLDPPDSKFIDGGLDRIAGLLFGTDEFSYLGKVQVRGQAARVMESHGYRLPAWLLDHTPYKDWLDIWHIRQDPLVSGGSLEESEFRHVVYFATSDDNFEQGADSPPIPIMLEIYMIANDDVDRLKFVGNDDLLIVRVEFHQFQWDLVESPGGDLPHQLFSSDKLCGTIDSSMQKFAQVEIYLEVDETRLNPSQKDSSWIQDWSRRNLALLSAIRGSLDIPSLSISELDSRIFHQKPLSIAVNFRAKELPNQLLQLTFLGRGTLVKTDASSTVPIVEVYQHRRTLDTCLALIGSISETGVLVYYSIAHGAGYCLIDRKTNDPHQSDHVDVDTQGLGELYRIEPILSEPEKSLAGTWLKPAKFRNLVDRMMVLQHLGPGEVGFQPSREEFYMRIKVAKLKNSNPTDQVGYDDSTPGSETFPISIDQFKLDPSDPYVRQLDLGQVSRNLQGCEAACLTDFTCRSYSYCTYSAECLLSSVSLGYGQVFQQVHEPAAKRLKAGQKILIEIHNPRLSLNIIKDYRCELRNKLYLSYFELPSESSLVGQSHDIELIDNVEQCAQSCFTRTLKAIFLGPKLSTQTGHKSLVDGLLDESELNEVRSRENQIEAEMCFKFGYLEGAIAEKELSYLSLRGFNETSPAGICLLPRSQTRGLYDSKTFECLEYELDLSSLFIETRGVRMKLTSSAEEMKAFVNIQYGQTRDRSDFRLIHRAIQEGRNFQRRQLGPQMNAAACAHMCLLRGLGVWPACHSFDLVVTERGADCIINSASIRSITELKNIDRSDFLKSADPHELMTSHYEPKFRLLDRLADIETEASESEIELFQNRSPSHLVERLGWFTSLIIMVLSLVSAAAVSIVPLRIFRSRVDLSDLVNSYTAGPNTELYEIT